VGTNPWLPVTNTDGIPDADIRHFSIFTLAQTLDGTDPDGNGLTGATEIDLGLHPAQNAPTTAIPQTPQNNSGGESSNTNTNSTNSSSSGSTREQCVASLGAPLCDEYNNDLELIEGVGQRCANEAQNGQFTNECDRYVELVPSIPIPDLSNINIESQNNANDCILFRQDIVNDVNAQFIRFDLFNECNQDLNVMYWVDGQLNFDCLSGCLNRVNSRNSIPLGSEFNNYFFAACHWPGIPAPLQSNGNIDILSSSQGVTFSVDGAGDREWGCI